MKTNWNVSVLIIEGVCGTGKSTLLKALTRSRRFVERPFLSGIVLSEHQTQRVLERKEREDGLVPADNLALLDQHVSYLEALRRRLEPMDWCDRNRTNMRIACVLERFHFTHVYHYPHMQWRNVEGIDRRLAALDCRLCLLTMDDAGMVRRIVRERGQAWRAYLSRYGRTVPEIVEHYRRQQQVLLGLAEQSHLRTMTLDTTDADVEGTVTKIFDFWSDI